MISVVTPHGHLPLAVVHGMQRPESRKSMLRPVIPVVEQVKNQEINDQADPSLVRHARPKLVQMNRRKTQYMGLAKKRQPQGLHHEKQRHAKQTKTVNQGIQDVHSDLLAILDWLGRNQPLSRPHHDDQQSDLQQANQQPHCAVVGIFDVIAHAQVKQHGLGYVFKYPLVSSVKGTDEWLHDQRDR